MPSASTPGRTEKDGSPVSTLPRADTGRRISKAKPGRTGWKSRINTVVHADELTMRPNPKYPTLILCTALGLCAGNKQTLAEGETTDHAGVDLFVSGTNGYHTY